MDRFMRHRIGSPISWAAALALVLGAASGQAWSAPPSSADSLERAASLIDARDFPAATATLRRVLATDPSSRRAREMLAFALESTGDLAGERRVRTGLAREFPRDPRIQADYGRVLERSGEPRDALRAYRRAQELSPAGPTPDLDAAIARMSGRTAPEVGAPLMLLSDPDAVAWRAQAAASVAAGAREHLAVIGTHAVSNARTGSEATSLDGVTLSVAGRSESGADWSVASLLHALSPRGAARRDLAAGGSIAARTPLGAWLEADGRGELEAPWDEAAVALLRGGRTTGAEAHVYAHALDRRILLQVGARRRRLSVLERPSPARARAWQSLGLAGADLVLWRRPAAAVRGEMLDEQMAEPSTRSSALTLAYRHYDVTGRSTPEFDARLGLVPRSAVDEGSIAACLVSRGGRAGVELRGGLGRDAARAARTWRAGGDLVWSPTPTMRLTLGYEGATELVTGLTGRRHAGWLSLHADL